MDDKDKIEQYDKIMEIVQGSEAGKEIEKYMKERGVTDEMDLASIVIGLLLVVKKTAAIIKELQNENDDKNGASYITVGYDFPPDCKTLDKENGRFAILISKHKAGKDGLFIVVHDGKWCLGVGVGGVNDGEGNYFTLDQLINETDFVENMESAPRSNGSHSRMKAAFLILQTLTMLDVYDEETVSQVVHDVAYAHLNVADKRRFKTGGGTNAQT